jgi:hypothetical protein
MSKATIFSIPLCLFSSPDDGSIVVCAIEGPCRKQRTNSAARHSRTPLVFAVLGRYGVKRTSPRLQVCHNRASTIGSLYYTRVSLLHGACSNLSERAKQNNLDQKPEPECFPANVPWDGRETFRECAKQWCCRSKPPHRQASALMVVVHGVVGKPIPWPPNFSPCSRPPRSRDRPSPAKTLIREHIGPPTIASPGKE